VGSTSAELEVEAPISAAEALWYDLARWPGFVDGLHHVVKADADWPRAGRVLWDSRPNGRGRVQERVVSYEVRSGQTVEVEDPRLSGTQSIAFEPAGEGRCRVTLTLDYRLKQGGPFAPVVDSLFVRRAVRDALRRTLSRFARELRADRELGV
jgi:uncharacterized membrane protein